MKFLQINTIVNSGSHGRIAEEHGKLLIEKGHESYIAYSRGANNSDSELIKIGKRSDVAFHVLITRVFDRHGFGSINATRSFLKEVDKINPDLIHLHNVHGYYLNIGLLFEYIKNRNKPVVWTLHDCWPFTGHCSHFQHVNCNKWQTGCYDCPNIHGYPKSLFIDNSRKNFYEKKMLFTGLKNMLLVSPSEWLAAQLRNSFLSDNEIRVINNGIDLEKFRPLNSNGIRAKYNLKRKYVIGVASTWSERKGLGDFIRLREILNAEIEIVLVGLTRSQIKTLHPGIKGIFRTESVEELASFYSGAEVLVNPTYVDNFPSVNIEALACGTPVITYNTGGSAEAIDIRTGLVVEKGNVRKLCSSIMEVMNSNDMFNSAQCRDRAVRKYSAWERFGDYLNLYQERLTHA